ncbi:MAG: thermonuclease family protein [Chitinophagaceae bacterium]
MLKDKPFKYAAPETKHSFGEAAKESMSKLILGKTVIVDSSNLDRFNEVLASGSLKYILRLIEMQKN